MNSTNFQHHEQQQHHHHHQQQLQDHFGVGCSPLNIPPSPYAVSNNASLHWNTNSTSAILPTSTATSSNTFSNKPYENDFLSSAAPNSPIPKIEDGDMLTSFPSFSSLLQNPTSATTLDNMNNPWSFNGLLSSASAGGVPYSRGLMQQFPLEPNNWNNNNNNSNNNHHGFSSTSFLNQLGLVSSPNNSTASTVSSSSPRLGLNLQAMDFLGNNSSFSSQSRPMSYDVVGEEVISPAAGKIMSNKNSSLMSGSLTGTKRAARSSSSDQSKASTSNSHASTKKSPLKVSCPPFKVRKEKLGERIAALHQLVSPFGKTDTASVLTEAIGYIQFLQDQIHTLCMPHPKPSRSKPSRPFQAGLGISEDEGKEEERVELRRRGLCLVPFSWTSYITPNQMDGSNHHPPYF